MPHANVVRFLVAQDRWLNNFSKEIVYVPGIVECVDSSAKKDLPRKLCKNEIKRCVQQTEYGVHGMQKVSNEEQFNFNRPK